MNDWEELAENRKQRMSAIEVFDLALEMADSFHGSPVRFWEELRSRVCVFGEQEEKSLRNKMTDLEAKHFGCHPIPFGEFAGRRVDDVPLDRLQWYADQSFVDDLRRYLDSDRIKGETR